MKSYLFIPGNNIRFIEKTVEIDASDFIIDLEDAIYNKPLEKSINNILQIHPPDKYYIRISYSPGKSIAQLNYLKRILSEGYNKFVIPKIKTFSDIDTIQTFLSNNLKSKKEFKLIVLVENSSALMNLSEILSSDFISGVGFGSHDYCADTGMKHTLKNIYWARMNILNTGKAMGKEVIDIASMNISDETDFIEECKNGYEMGFDSKFLIHPWQVKIFNSIQYYSDKEIDIALSVKKHIAGIGGIDKFTIARIKGKVIEKAHLKEINKILSSKGYETI
jgi:citrate lyase beta subunit